MNKIELVSKHLNNHSEPLANKVVEKVLQNMNLLISELEKQHAIIMYTDFMKFLGSSLIDEQKEIPEIIIKWSKGNAKAQLGSGQKISEIVNRYGPTRDVLVELLTQISSDYNLSIKENALLLQKANSILDVSLKETIYSFECLSGAKIEEEKKKRAEWSSPIVPIKKGIAVLPFIGEIDNYRLSYILEKVIPSLPTLEIEYLIADFSGIFAIDKEVTFYLDQFGKMLNLLGIEVLVSGVRPETAIAAIQSGIDLSSAKTFVNVHKALDYLQKDIN